LKTPHRVKAPSTRLAFVQSMLLLRIIRPFQASNQTQSTLFIIYFGNDTTPSIEHTKPNLPKATNSNASTGLAFGAATRH
jgi:hypothetical protein